MQNRLTFELNKFVGMVNLAGNHILREQFDVNFSEFLMLIGLLSLGDIPQKDLAAFSGLSKGMVSRLVVGLKARELLTIEGNATDRRQDIVRLTPAGRDLAVSSADALEKAFVTYIVQDISPAEMEAFSGTLNKLITNVTSLSVGMPKGKE